MKIPRSPIAVAFPEYCILPEKWKKIMGYEMEEVKKPSSVQLRIHSTDLAAQVTIIGNGTWKFLYLPLEDKIGDK